MIDLGLIVHLIQQHRAGVVSSLSVLQDHIIDQGVDPEVVQEFVDLIYTHPTFIRGMTPNQISQAVDVWRARMSVSSQKWKVSLDQACERYRRGLERKYGIK